MNRFALILGLLSTITPAFAGNARSEATARAFVYRMQRQQMLPAYQPAPRVQLGRPAIVGFQSNQLQQSALISRYGTTSAVAAHWIEGSSIYVFRRR